MKNNLSDYTIRPMEKNEFHLLEIFLYEAIFQDGSSEKLPIEIIFNPDIFIYIENFGIENDFCLLAENFQNEIVGAVWTRILDGEIKGFGNIDSFTPEFGISVLPTFRNLGIGTLLMNEMIKFLKQKKYLRTSLSVDKKNYAFNLYSKLGFEIVKERDSDYLMVLNLN